MKLSEINPAVLDMTNKHVFGSQVIEETAIDMELNAYEATMLGYLKEIAENTRK